MFAEPQYLYLLIFAPLFFALFMWRLRANKLLLKSYIKNPCLKVVINSKAQGLRVLRFFFSLMAFLFLIVALARPRSLEKQTQQIDIKGAEVMILADVSKSMQVKDIGGFSRLEVMKKELSRLIDKLSGQRVGLISFSGATMLVSPLTLDHSSLKLFLKTLSPKDHILQGTDFGGALNAGARALKRGTALPPPIKDSQVLLVASDGEDKEKQALKVAKTLAEENFRIFTLGFGSGKGGMIPIQDKQGRKVGYKKDLTGTPVISRFNEEVLKNIARVGRGAFYHVLLQSQVVEKIYNDIQTIGQKAISKESQNVYKENYTYPAVLALLFGTLFFASGRRTAAGEG